MPSSPSGAPAIAGTGDAAAPLEPGPRTKKPTRRRQKRVLSCETCQRLKCRCEFDPSLESCRRCQTLRLVCSLKEGEHRSVTITRSAESLPVNTIEDRLNSHETALTEIKSLLSQLVSTQRPPSEGHQQQKQQQQINRVAGPGQHNATPQDAESSTYTDDVEDVSNPADRAVSTAPAVVIREMSRQLVGGYRRLLQNIELDLVKLGIGLGEELAQRLFQLFINSRPGFVIIHGTDSKEAIRNLRIQAPFLFSVCCLVAMRYWEEKHEHEALIRTSYEHIRSALGQVVLASPLSLGDVNAVEILCSFSSAPSMNGVEYIDSWLLSGFCVQHAMLSISFSRIVDNVRKGIYTATDYREIKLWARICLNHLQWAATTGRPSSIAPAYLFQSYILINMDQATVQDGQVVADIHLYSSLHRALGTRPRSHDEPPEEEFSVWKRKWGHLFSQPNAPMLELSYYAAHLILAVRCIAENADEVCQDHFHEFDFSSPTHMPPYSAQHERSPRTQHRQNSPVTSNSRGDYEKHTEKHEALACKYALLMIQRSIDIDASLVTEMPEYLKLCLAYSTFVVTHYQPGPDITPELVLDSLKTLEVKARAHFYFRPNPLSATIIARQNLEKRYGGWAQESVTDDPNVPSFRQDIANDGPHLPTERTPTTLSATNVQHMEYNTMWRTHNNETLAMFDLETSFPSIEDFFAGGFTLPDLELQTFVGIG